MRMWMVNPIIMCQKHLLGEHVEIHMLTGTLNKFKSISGYIKNNCIELKSIWKRHNEIVKEMYKRKYNHQSKLIPFDYSYLPLNEQEYEINKEQSLKDLLSRCEKCRKRYEEIKNEYK